MIEYKNIFRPGFPYPKPSFLRGFAGALNLFGRRDALQAISDTPWRDDEAAIAHDWEMVGKDLRSAFEDAGCK